MNIIAKRVALAALGTLTLAALARAAAGTHLSAKNGNTDSAPGRTARRNRFGDFVVFGRTVTIQRTREEVFQFCCDLNNLSKITQHSARVSDCGDGVTRWIIDAPTGMTVTADVQHIADRPGEEISWKSTASSQIETRGKVLFRDAPAGRGTEVEAITAYRPPLGEFGKIVTKLFGDDPAVQTRHALKRMKMLMETGETATAQNRRDAQPS